MFSNRIKMYFSFNKINSSLTCATAHLFIFTFINKCLFCTNLLYSIFSGLLFILKYATNIILTE